MSHCKACDVILTDFEATRKYAGTAIEVELCNHCLSFIELDVDERVDLADFQRYHEEHYESIEEDPEEIGS
jgi:hypothetical protein